MIGLVVSVLPVLAPAGAGDGEECVLRPFRKIVLSEKFWAEGAHFGDFNRDGRMDVVAGPYWYEGPDFRKTHEIYPPQAYDKEKYSKNFFTFTWDVNGDGWTDVIVYGFPGEDGSWFENPRGGEGHWKKTVILDNLENESPTFADLDGDRRPDLVCGSRGTLGYATLDGKFHAVTPKNPKKYQRYTHGLGLGDINGDGRMDLLEKDGWWEQPANLEGDPVWTRHEAKFGDAPAQICVFDFDGDGDNDVLTSLHCHLWGLAWFEQVKEEGTVAFRQHLIAGSKPEDNRYGVRFSQMHAIELADMDGDGVKDVVTGKRHFAHGSKGDAEPLAPPVLYWFRTVRSGKEVDFVPYRIDDDSGVGTQVTVGDLNGDGHPDIVVGNKRGVFVFLQEPRKVSRAEWEKAQPKPLR